MTFDSMVFLWIFLPITLIVYYIIKNKYKNIFLVLASLILYTWGSIQTLPILLGSIFINYLLGRAIDKQSKQIIRKIFFIIGLVFNIGLLGYFKYYNFFVENINNIFSNNMLNLVELALPLGISFFTFSAISYIFDVYRGNVKVQKNIINLALYISFFPKLTMGPIESYKDFEIFIQNKNISISNFASGIKRFIYGLSKKVIIANSMGIIADYVFESDFAQLTFPVAWIGAICYMIQIYFDFSGYSDMAIGLGKMFGFNLKENFNLPYISTSITEFWRRWHISLSTWFKNYLYIPLGGNRKGKIRTYINLFIVFLTTGLWHGSAWNYIVWGLFNGCFMIVERIKLKELLDKNKFKFINHIYALFVILISWIFFRVNELSDALFYIKSMFNIGNLQLDNSLDISSFVTAKNILIFVFGILLSGVLQVVLARLTERYKKIKQVYEIFFEPILLVLLFIISIMTIVNSTYVSYIYLKF